jgi:hypothetical protein
LGETSQLAGRKGGDYGLKFLNAHHKSIDLPQGKKSVRRGPLREGA